MGKVIYETPHVEILEVQVEHGYTLSDSSPGSETNSNNGGASTDGYTVVPF